MTTGELNELLATVPFHHSVPMEVTSFEPDAQRMTVVVAENAGLARMKGSPQVHGGVLSVVIDTAGCFLLVGLLGIAAPTVDLRVDFLRAASGSLTTTATARRIGRTVAVIDVEITNTDGKPVAIGRCTYGTDAARTDRPPSA